MKDDCLVISVLATDETKAALFDYLSVGDKFTQLYDVLYSDYDETPDSLDDIKDSIQLVINLNGYDAAPGSVPVSSYIRRNGVSVDEDSRNLIYSLSNTGMDNWIIEEKEGDMLSQGFPSLTIFNPDKPSEIIGFSADEVDDLISHIYEKETGEELKDERRAEREIGR